jgi:hypothetical protein
MEYVGGRLLRFGFFGVWLLGAPVIGIYVDLAPQPWSHVATPAALQYGNTWGETSHISALVPPQRVMAGSVERDYREAGVTLHRALGDSPGPGAAAR